MTVMASLGWVLSITVFLQGLPSTPAVASEETVACEQPKTTLEMGECVKDAMDAADRELSKVFDSLVSEMRRSKRKALATELAKHQREWVKYRRKNCDDESYEAAGGGTLESLYFGDCYARLTNERVLELKQQYDEMGHK